MNRKSQLRTQVVRSLFVLAVLLFAGCGGQTESDNDILDKAKADCDKRRGHLVVSYSHTRYNLWVYPEYCVPDGAYVTLNPSK